MDRRITTIRILILLTAISALAAIALFLLQAFMYVIAAALVVVFGCGALIALAIQQPPTGRR